MSARATGEFSVSSWDEQTYEELPGGGKLTRASVGFGLKGDLEAEADWQALMCYRQDGNAEFTGLQRMTGRLAGREGSFVLRADGTYGDGKAVSRWEVIPGTATGDLRGLSGTGESVSTEGSAGGTYLFDYAIGES